MATYTIDEIAITRTASNIDDNDVFELQIKDGSSDDLKSAKITKLELQKLMNDGATPLRYKALLSNTYTEQISGELVIGKEYVAILNGSDNFSNVGYVSDGVVFEATGTTPTYWGDGSVVYDIEENQPTEIIALLNSIGVDVEVGFLIGVSLGFFFNSDGKFLEDKLFLFPIGALANNVQRVDDERLFLRIGASYNKLPIFFEVYP